MNQSLIALALSGAASAAFIPAAQAQSSVTLYGIVDVSMRYESDALAGKSKFAQTSGMLNTSRWGVRGTEDLGNGLKANFQLEGGIGHLRCAARRQ